MVIPYWGLFLSWIPAQLPEPFGFGLWIGVGIILLFLVARYLNTPIWLFLISYQFNWVVFHGQIDPYVIFGIIFGFWAVRNSKPYFLGIALMVALIKPQISLLPALILFWWSPDKKKTVLVAILIGLASLAIWPTWVFDVIQSQWSTFLSREANIRANTSLGLPLTISIPFVLLSFAIRLERKDKLVLLLATNLLVAPYSPIYSQLALLVMGLPSIFYIFGLIPWIVSFAFGPHWGWAFIFPLLLWLYLAIPPIWLATQYRFNKLNL